MRYVTKGDKTVNSTGLTNGCTSRRLINVCKIFVEISILSYILAINKIRYVNLLKRSYAV